jgi:hypothetical protein
MNRVTPKCTSTGGIVPIKDFKLLLGYKSTKYALIRATAAARAQHLEVDAVLFKLSGRWFVSITAGAREYLERKKAAENAERVTLP